MNNPRLLTGLLAATLWGGMSAHAQSGKVYTLEEIFETAEANSSMLRPSLSAETVEQCDLASAKAARLPELSASLSLGFNGNGFTTARDFSDYRKAPIPHLNNVAGVSVTQPVYAGGAINGAIELAERKSTAARLATELSRDNIRLRLTGFYLDLYKYSNMRRVVNENIANARQVLEDMRHRYQQGMILLNDITRYELLLSDMDLQLIRIDNMMSILNNNLASTAGLPEGTVIQPDTALLNRSLSILSEAEWQSNASTNSPALKLAGQSVAINRTAEKLIKADYKETQLKHIHPGSDVEITVDALPDVTYHGKVVSISNATGASLSMLPQDNSAGNFVKVRQRVPVRIEFTDRNSKKDLEALRAGMNVECKIPY